MPLSIEIWRGWGEAVTVLNAADGDGDARG
jgi:hypothetical protein